VSIIGKSNVSLKLNSAKNCFSSKSPSCYWYS